MFRTLLGAGGGGSLAVALLLLALEAGASRGGRQQQQHVCDLLYKNIVFFPPTFHRLADFVLASSLPPTCSLLSCELSCVLLTLDRNHMEEQKEEGE